jgi:signal transduction histidine kinase/CheY-like chemotaxis protein/HAMP domain-containing protein
MYEWKRNIGDRMISIADSGIRGELLDRRLRELAGIEEEFRYLDGAQTLLQGMYHDQLSSLPLGIGTGITKVKDVEFFIIVINVLLAVFSIALGFVLTRSITKPVELLRGGTQNIMGGKYDQIEMHRKDEFGELAADFNRMAVMLQNNYGRLTAYSELMTTLNRYDTLTDVQSKSLEILCTHTRSAVGALYILDSAKGTLTLVAGYALKSEAAIQEYRIGQGLPGQCASMSQTLEVADVTAASAFVVETGLVSVVPSHVIASPIVFQENVIGVVILGSTQRYDDLKRDVISNSLPQMGVSIMNAMNNDATKKLSKEIAGKNQELGNKNAELQKAYRVKSDFLSNMSHELRTPLNSIIGFTSVLLGQHGDPLSADQRKALDKVLKNGRHLLQLINDILDFSKIESGRSPINIEADDIANVVSGGMVSVEPMVNAKGVKLLYEIEPGLPLLNTDVLKVKQVLLNLLSNAAKFTEQGSITVIAKKADRGMISISVKDSGIGIEERNLDRVFEEFQQIDSSSSRKYKGTGLGLPIAKSYARLLGGDLTLQTAYGKGSTFTLTIPPVFPKEKLPRPEGTIVPVAASPALAQTVAAVASAAPKQAEAPSVPQPLLGSKGIQVLSIDDEPEVIELLQRYLVPEGFSVRGALTGDEGIRLAEEIQPAVITLDIMMPDKDGWQVLRELKNNPKTKDIPVIVHSVIDNKPLAVSLGALDLMPKPSEAKKILEVVDRALKSKDRRVLIVDDNEDFANYVQIILQQEGYQTTVAYSGEEALKSVSESVPALMFLDLSMPVMDGFEVVRRLRMKPEWRDIPVVILSGKDLTKEERDALRANIQEFIEKGHFTRDAITNVLRKAIPRSVVS